MRFPLLVVSALCLSLVHCVGDAPITPDLDASKIGDQAAPPGDASVDVVADAPAVDPTWTLPLVAKSAFNAVVVDVYGDVYVAGALSEPLTLTNVNIPSTQGDDIFVMKLDAKTKLPVWGKVFGGTGDESASAMATDGNAIYIVGTTTSSSLTFGAKNVTIPSGSSSFPLHSFVAKLDPANGGVVWALSPDSQRTPNAAHSSLCRSISAVAKTLAIGCSYTGANFGLGTATVTPPNNGSGLAVLTLDSFTSPVLTRSFYQPSGIVIPSVSLGANGDVWVAASMWGSNTLTDLDKNTSVFTTTGASNPFVMKIDQTGAVGPAKFWSAGLYAGNKLPSAIYKLAVSSADIFVSGVFGGTAAFDKLAVASQGLADGFALRLDLSLAGQSQFTFGGTMNDSITAIAPDGAGGAYAAVQWASSNVTFGGKALPDAPSGGFNAALGSLDGSGKPGKALPSTSTASLRYADMTVDVGRSVVYGVGGYTSNTTFDDGTKALGTLTGSAFLVRRAKF